MASFTRRPERSEEDGNAEEKTYRSRSIRLDIGGLNAKVGDYAGESIVPVRIMPRITKIQGRLSAAHALEGFDPETGEALILFFDTKLNDQDKYVRNFGGGLAEALGERMNGDEFDDAVEIIQAETETDLDYDFDAWGECGGALKLKEKFYGKPVIIGKECIKTKGRGIKMNVFSLDELTEFDPEAVDEFLDNYVSQIGYPAFTVTAREPPEPVKPAQPARKSEETKRTSARQAAKSTPAPTPASTPKEEPKKEPIKAAPATSATGRSRSTPTRQPVTPPAPEEKPAAKPVNSGREVVKRPSRAAPQKPAEKPVKKVAYTEEQVKGYTLEGVESGIAIDQLVATIMDKFSLTEEVAKGYIEAAFDSLETESQADEKAAESDILKRARDCAKQGLGVPETFEILSQEFGEASKTEKKEAMRQAGLYK